MPVRGDARRAREIIPHAPATVTDIENQRHEGLQQVVRNHVYIGVADHDHTVVQHDTKLLLVNHTSLA